MPQKERRHGTRYSYRMGCRCDECRAGLSEWQKQRRRRVADRGVIPAEMHGTIAGYKYWSCRCTACKAASAQSALELKDRRDRRETPDHVHGTWNGYNNWRCRCDACRACPKPWQKNRAVPIP